MRIVAIIGVALSAYGCGAAPIWLTVAAPALTYVASVNNVGAEALRFIDNKKIRQCHIDDEGENVSTGK